MTTKKVNFLMLLYSVIHVRLAISDERQIFNSDFGFFSLAEKYELVSLSFFKNISKISFGVFSITKT